MSAAPVRVREGAFSRTVVVGVACGMLDEGAEVFGEGRSVRVGRAEFGLDDARDARTRAAAFPALAVWRVVEPPRRVRAVVARARLLPLLLDSRRLAARGAERGVLSSRVAVRVRVSRGAL